MTYWFEIIKILTTVLSALLGWVIAHKLTSKRDLYNKKREIRINFLIEAYRKLERSIHNNVGEDFEKAISDIQLLGSKHQVELAKDAAVQFARNKNVDLENLLFDLRESLRSELNLEKVTEPFTWIRIKN